jgi:hypothetical protein
MPSEYWIHTLADKLPVIQNWIEDTLLAYHSQTTPVADLDLPHLGRYFPQKLLRETKTVHLSELLPLPPLSEIGLDEFSSSEEPATYEAVTYGDTIFLREALRSEVLYFHELVHVLQWERLGNKHYLFAYIAGLLEFGYDNNPLEEIAFSLQEEFRRGELPRDVTDRIHKHSDTIWQKTAGVYSVA